LEKDFNGFVEWHNQVALEKQATIETLEKTNSK